MANIVMSPEAERDLVRLGDYIAGQLKNPKAALNTVRKIKSRINMLTEFPLIGTSLAAVVSVDTDYRFLGSGSYLAFYRYENDNVLIDRILHGRQDYVSILLGDVQREYEDD